MAPLRAKFICEEPQFTLIVLCIGGQQFEATVLVCILCLCRPLGLLITDNYAIEDGWNIELRISEIRHLVEGAGGERRQWVFELYPFEYWVLERCRGEVGLSQKHRTR